MPSDEAHTLKHNLGMAVHKARTKFYINMRKLKCLLKKYLTVELWNLKDTDKGNLVMEDQMECTEQCVKVSSNVCRMKAMEV